MSIEFRDAVRQDAALLIIIAGGTGAGKTESAFRVATGLAGGKKFAVIDTEAGRALHKADDYDFAHADLAEPFTPERYGEAVKAADAAGYPVIVIDSGSHEYEGVGGVLEIQAEEFARMGSKDSARMSSWIVPKQRHKKAFVQPMLQTRAHIILCLRAEDKIEVVKVDGKTVVRPKESLVGANGWIPICEKRLPFEASMSFLVTADAPGIPKPIKLERRFAPFVPLDQPLSEETGKALATWAAGASSGSDPATASAAASGHRGGAPDVSTAPHETGEQSSDPEILSAQILERVDESKRAQVQEAIDKNAEKHADNSEAHVAWLQGQLQKFAETVAA